MFCGKCRRQPSDEMNRFTIRKNPSTGQFYGVDESIENFDPNPLVSRGLTQEEVIKYTKDLNR